jgi:CBS domain-containing protein
MSYRVKDYMDRSFLVTDVETSILDAAALIAGSVCDLIVIMEKGIPRGFVSAGDIVSKVIAMGIDPVKVRVREIMTTPCVTVDPDDDFLDASEMVGGGDDHFLVVIKNGIIYGVVTPACMAMRFGEYVDRAVKDVLRHSFSFR